MAQYTHLNAILLNFDVGALHCKVPNVSSFQQQPEDISCTHICGAGNKDRLDTARRKNMPIFVRGLNVARSVASGDTGDRSSGLPGSQRSNGKKLAVVAAGHHKE